MMTTLRRQNLIHPSLADGIGFLVPFFSSFSKQQKSPIRLDAIYPTVQRFSGEAAVKKELQAWWRDFSYPTWSTEIKGDM